MPYIARVLYSRQPEAFESTLEAGKLTALWNVTVAEVETVNLRVRLEEFSRGTAADAAMADGQVLYRANAKSLKDRVAAELSKYLVGTVDCADTFARILIENDAEGIEEFLGVVAIGHLPADLERAVRQRELLIEADIERTGEEAAEDNSISDGPEESLAGDSGVTADDASPAEPATGESTDMAASTTTVEEERNPRPAGSTPVPSLTPAPPSSTSPNQPAPTLPRPLASLLTSPPTGTPTERVTANRGDAQIGRPSTGGLPSPGHGGGSVGSQHHMHPAAATNVDGEPPSPVDPPVASSPSHNGPNAPSQGASVPSGRIAQLQPFRSRGGRLLSYVEGPAVPDRQGSGEDSDKAMARDAVGRAAVAHFLKTQAKRWASLTEMAHNNPGFDVLARDSSGEDEYIEVKGQSGAWTQEGVALTPTELLMAQRMRDRYWLCVVEFAQDDKRRQLHLLNDPFGLVTQFRFDVGWKAAAENVLTAPTVPEKGLYIDIAGVGSGRILSVRGKGAFFNVHVILKDGQQVNSLFHPVKMSLSKEPLWQE